MESREARRAEARKLVADARLWEFTECKGTLGDRVLRQWRLRLPTASVTITDTNDGALFVMHDWGYTAFAGFSDPSGDILGWIGGHSDGYAASKVGRACENAFEHDVELARADLEAWYVSESRASKCDAEQEAEAYENACDALSDSRVDRLVDILTEDDVMDTEEALAIGRDVRWSVLISHAAVARCHQLMQAGPK